MKGSVVQEETCTLSPRRRRRSYGEKGLWLRSFTTGETEAAFPRISGKLSRRVGSWTLDLHS